MLLNKFEKFLQSVNLIAYREKYRPIKLVEMDLPKETQAIAILYQVYWDQKKFLNYDDFYKEYLNKYKTEIESFRQKITMCKKRFTLADKKGMSFYQSTYCDDCHTKYFPKKRRFNWD